MKRIKWLICVMAVLATACSAPKVKPAIEQDSEVERQVEEILKGMTLEQKVGQMAELGIDMFGNSVTGVAENREEDMAALRALPTTRNLSLKRVSWRRLPRSISLARC